MELPANFLSLERGSISTELIHVLKHVVVLISISDLP